MTTKKASLGIIGGMGSVAAAYFFKRLIELTPAKTDQDYIETFVHNNTIIPDRTQGILNGGQDPLPELKRSVETLGKCGADYIVMACITSHYFIHELQKIASSRILDVTSETVSFTKNKFPEITKVGIIGSTGAMKLGLFQNKFALAGIEPIIMNDSDQITYFTEPIYENWGIKAGFITGEPKERLKRATEILREGGAQAIVAGCSELPLVLKQEELDFPLIDSIDILIQSAIDRCLGTSSYGKPLNEQSCGSC